MDETEKYKQRLEAIAEKRRLQEEQDKAKRELEDEKLRLQQLKRKSLRDQWLMEGAPLSPTSLNSQSSRSPPWGTPTQDLEATEDELQSDPQLLAEEEDEVENVIEADPTGLLNVAEEEAEMIQSFVLNGENRNHSATASDTVKVNGEDIELSENNSISEQNVPPPSNGPVEDTAYVVCVKADLSLSEGEAEPGQLSYHKEEEEKEEDDEGTVLMRAERVMITDEGDDTSEEDNKEQPEDVHLLNPKEEVVQEGENTETLTEPMSELIAEDQPPTEDGHNEDETRESETTQIEVEAKNREINDPLLQLESPDGALEGATVAQVPIYSEAQNSILVSKSESKVEVSAGTEGGSVEEPPCGADHFQNVSLSDPQENHRTKEEPGEKEPLLSDVKAPANSTAEPARSDGEVSTEKQIPSRAEGQIESPQSPKRCSSCCSVM